MFYPEGGGLVKGLMSRVAFDVSYEREGAFDTEGFLCNERGDMLTEVKTFREGRGVFNDLPGATKVELAIKDRKGNVKRFPLPDASDTGRVILCRGDNKRWNPKNLLITQRGYLGLKLQKRISRER